MAEADWNIMTGSALDTGTVYRGVTAAFTVAPTSTGGTFTFGYRAAVGSKGVAGYTCALANFAPVAGVKKCGTFSAAFKRLSSGTTYAPFFGFVKGTDPASAVGYVVALTQETSYKIALWKGSLAAGFSATSTSALRTTTGSYTAYGDAATAWHHVQLEVLENPHGEVILDVTTNDLTTNDVESPVFAAVSGLTTYVDDPLGFYSGSAPYLDGFYAVYGMYTDGTVGDACLFDYIVVKRQTAP